MGRLKEHVPPGARGPVGVGSLLIGVLGFTIGYILVVLGIALVYDLAPHEVPTYDAVMVFLIGAVLVVSGYLGLKGFMYFSY